EEEKRCRDKGEVKMLCTNSKRKQKNMIYHKCEDIHSKNNSVPVVKVLEHKQMQKLQLKENSLREDDPRSSFVKSYERWQEDNISGLSSTELPSVLSKGMPIYHRLYEKGHLIIEFELNFPENGMNQVELGNFGPNQKGDTTAMETLMRIMNIISVVVFSIRPLNGT
ncbi:hypothetical protein J0S82_007049, partial [Galemys pyrenaicus]